MKTKTVLLVLGALLATLSCVPTGDAPAASESMPNQFVTVEGQNVCIGCFLKKENGAVAQCSTYGHRHALRIDKVFGADGYVVPSLVGQTLHYLDNDVSAPMQQDEAFHSQKVEVKGMLYTSEHMIEVSEVNMIEEAGA